mgnify:CR=1 FL=1
MNRRGVSPVIAVLLLVIIAVAAAILTYLWVLGYMGTVQRGGTTEALQERIKVEGVRISGDDIVGVYVRNIGDVEVRIREVYVVFPTGHTEYRRFSERVLDPGEMELISFSGIDLEPGVTYTVRVVTLGGAEGSYVFTLGGT